MSAIDATPTQESTRQSSRQQGALGQKKTWVLLLLAIVLLVGLCVWLIDYLFVGRFLEKTNDAYLQADVVTIAPRISGYVTRVFVTDNQTIAAGEPLFEIDDRPFTAALHQAQAAVAARGADLAQAKASLESQHAALAQAKSQLSAAQANLDFASGQMKRFAPLVATGADSREHQESLKLSLDRARADYAGAQAYVTSSEQLVHVAAARIQQAQAALLAANADVEQTRISVDDTRVFSVLAGRIGDKKIQVGQLLSAGMPTMTIVPIHSVYLVANFKETQVGKMKPGLPVTITIDALDDRTFHGVIESISPGTGAQFALFPPENATGNFTKVVQRVPVRIRIDADDATRQALLPGLSAEATVDTRDQRDAHQTAPVASTRASVR